MYLLAKSLEDIQEADLIAMIDAGAQEGEMADFKRDVWGTSDSEKRKMLYDIASLANRRGGELYLGIDEEDGTAIAISGVEGEGLTERIIQSCRANIAPALPVSAHPVPLASGKSVIVVRVPFSLTGPHMITFKGRNQFWVRHGRTNAAMTVEEIEGAFHMRREGEDRIRKFLEVRHRVEYAQASGNTWISLSSTPLFHRTGLIDTSAEDLRTLIRNPPTLSNVSSARLHAGEPRPTLEGISAERVRDGSPAGCLEVHRNGLVHWGALLPHADEHGIPAKLLAGLVFDFVHLARSVYDNAGVVGPMAFSFVLFNVANTWLAVGNHMWPDERTYWSGEVLAIPMVVAQILPTDAGRVIKDLNDRLWNAYRLESCRYLDENGEFVQDAQ